MTRIVLEYKHIEYKKPARIISKEPINVMIRNVLNRQCQKRIEWIRYKEFKDSVSVINSSLNKGDWNPEYIYSSNSEKVNVFVYGNLKKGQSQSETFLGDQKFIGQSITDGYYNLYCCSSFPIAVPTPKVTDHLEGDLWEIDRKTFDALDQYMSDGRILFRSLRSFYFKHKVYFAWIYEWPIENSYQLKNFEQLEYEWFPPNQVANKTYVYEEEEDIDGYNFSNRHKLGLEGLFH